MSHLLWKYYVERDVDRFIALLANSHVGASSSATVAATPARASHHHHHHGALSSPNATPLGTSPRPSTKARKASNHAGPPSMTKNNQLGTLGRAEVNARDFAGLTVLHRAASDNEIAFATALINHPAIDLYLQDLESGWTALHRALYFGNITIARAILQKDHENTKLHGAAAASRAGMLIKIKDREGNTAFDVYNSTITKRSLAQRIQQEQLEEVASTSDDDEGSVAGEDVAENPIIKGLDGDEVFSFGSNKNLTLGFGDGDDRQFPERIVLKRPDHLIQRFHREHTAGREVDDETHDESGDDLSQIPTLTQNLPIIIQDVSLSKLSSAILTTDPESNLYMCGYGKGGRLGTGDERTMFQYVCIEGGALAGKKIAAVALGQNHTMAISDEGETFTWGTNTWGQLGYNLPRPALKDEEPVNTVPRQIFGALKNEHIVGIAASGIHSVAHTSTSLYTWGKNEGQLGLMDSDSRSLESQTIPRKVAASQFNAPIKMVSAINRATICLLANHTVRVFTNYGYIIVKFPMHETFTGRFLRHVTTDYGKEPNHISMVTSGGDTIAAISSRGDLFTVNVSQKLDPSGAATSTTNPAKIRDALSQPQRIWSLRKGNWDGIQSVSVGEDGSVILCTKAGTVWRRVKRAKINDSSSQASESKRKDYKFQRISGLSNVVAVRSNVFGAYAAIRKDCDITKTQITVDDKTLWADLWELFALNGLEGSGTAQPDEATKDSPLQHLDSLKRAVLTSPDLEADVARHLEHNPLIDESYNVLLASTVSDVQIPVHGFMLGGRSSVLRQALVECRMHGSYTISEVLSITIGSDEKMVVTFQGLDFISLINFAMYLYSDNVVGVWHFGRHTPNMAFRYRQIRTELMKLAQKLKMLKLEEAVRLMRETEPSLDADMASAVIDPDLFEDADALIELDGDEIPIHSALACQRCPFFDGLFNGRAAGQWLAGRRLEAEPVRIDLQHIDPTAFEFVMRYLYADVGLELFDDVACADIDEFCELVYDVMEVANELMLDRLSQICQNVIGRFVTTRNVCQLLNLVAPCSVTTFKDTALEYLCLQLESMLENHLLDELEEELMLELDDIVRANQLALLSNVRAGTAAALLHERHPSLAEDISEERQRKVRDMAFRVGLEKEEKLSSSFRARVGSVEDGVMASPSTEKARRKSRTQRNTPFSPSIRPKDSATDLMFDMDDDEAALPHALSPQERPSDWTASKKQSSVPKDILPSPKGKSMVEDEVSPGASPMFGRSIDAAIRTKLTPTGEAAAPWNSSALPSTKLDMREIMAQASSSSSRPSGLSIGLADQKKEQSLGKAATSKISQKERKRQQQQAFQLAQKPTEKPASPWQLVTSKPTPQESPVVEAKPPPKPSAKLSVPANTTAQSPHRRTASPDTRHSGQQRKKNPPVNSPSPFAPSPSYVTPSPGPARDTSYLSAVSKTYRAVDVGKSEPSIQLSFADIIGEQKLQQDLAKEAVATRSLQEIQDEQAFQEWWDKESKRAQEEEERRKRAVERPSKNKGRRGKGSENAKPASGGGAAASLGSKQQHQVPAKPGESGAASGNGGGGGNRGRGRGKDKEKKEEKPHPNPPSQPRGANREGNRERRGKDPHGRGHTGLKGVTA